VISKIDKSKYFTNAFNNALYFFAQIGVIGVRCFVILKLNPNLFYFIRTLNITFHQTIQ
jgi:hypothetical protein